MPVVRLQPTVTDRRAAVTDRQRILGAFADFEPSAIPR
jgi:hypothetical protein